MSVMEILLVAPLIWVQPFLGRPGRRAKGNAGAFPRRPPGLSTGLKCHCGHRFSRRGPWRSYRNLIKGRRPDAILMKSLYLPPRPHLVFKCRFDHPGEAGRLTDAISR